MLNLYNYLSLLSAELWLDCPVAGAVEGCWVACCVCCNSGDSALAKVVEMACTFWPWFNAIFCD